MFCFVMDNTEKSITWFFLYGITSMYGTKVAFVPLFIRPFINIRKIFF